MSRGWLLNDSILPCFDQLLLKVYDTHIEGTLKLLNLAIFVHDLTHVTLGLSLHGHLNFLISGLKNLDGLLKLCLFRLLLLLELGDLSLHKLTELATDRFRS